MHSAGIARRPWLAGGAISGVALSGLAVLEEFADMPAPHETSTGAEKMYPTPRTVLINSGVEGASSILRLSRKT
jgi:hypothetical protein